MPGLRDTVDAVWRMEAARIVATLTRIVGDIGLAEDLAQEALVDALTQWPSGGVPRNAGAWLTTVAKRKAIDLWRRQDNLDIKYAELARDLEGYSASAGQRWVRDELCSEALRLGRVLQALTPDEPEVHALVALMEFQASRFAARTDADGNPVLLEDQDRTRWDRSQIQRGVRSLQHARCC